MAGEKKWSVKKVQLILTGNFIHSRYVEIQLAIITLSMFQEIDSLLQCPICKEHFDNTMMVPQCSHNCEFVD